MLWPIRQKQITMDYGRVRLWGSIAFVIGSALTGKLVSLFDYRAILLMLSPGSPRCCSACCLSRR